jgi:hypothetical protein
LNAYAIVNRGDIAEAMQKLESNRRELEGHVIGDGDETSPVPQTLPWLIN